jgi:hypothetical protein
MEQTIESSPDDKDIANTREVGQWEDRAREIVENGGPAASWGHAIERALDSP